MIILNGSSVIGCRLNLIGSESNSVRVLLHLVAVKRLQSSNKNGSEFLDQLFRSGFSLWNVFINGSFK